MGIVMGKLEILAMKLFFLAIWERTIIVVAAIAIP